MEQLVGPKVASQLAAIQSTLTLGGKTNVQSELLDMPAFSQPLPPPLPAEFKQMATNEGQKMMVERFQLREQAFEAIHPERFIGPFRRCRDVLVPEWMPIFDVPDITFSVTQDVDGDGDEETIYSEGYFDVRWDAGAIPDVTLEASQIALASISCDNPEMACAEPAIVLAGKMPVHNLPAPADPYIELTTGYAGGQTAHTPPGTWSTRCPTRWHPRRWQAPSRCMGATTVRGLSITAYAMPTGRLEQDHSLRLCPSPGLPGRCTVGWAALDTWNC